MLSIFAHASASDLIQPEIAIVTLVLLLLYFVTAFGPLRRLYKNPSSVTPKQIICFIGGSLVLYFSFGGPLDYISDNYLFSAHMVQHMAEVLFLAPLYIYGVPLWMIAPMLRIRWVSSLFSGWQNPVLSSIIFNVVLDAFHIPYLYDLALNHDNFHLFEHICFFITSIFLWLSRRPLSSGKQLLFLLLNYNLMMPLVIMMIVARNPWYTYYVHQPRIYEWLTPMADQQMGAIIMAVMMMGVYAYLGVKAYARQDESIWYD